MSNLHEVAREALQGAYDLHVHTGPDGHLPRCQDDLEFSSDAHEFGMAGTVLKNHYTFTTDRAILVRKLVPGFLAYGGVCLDRAVGGINPFSVEAAIGFIYPENLCKFVWMPTISAKSYAHRKDSDPGYGVLRDDGTLTQETCQVLELIRDHNLTLATGHLSVEEQVLLVRQAHQMGINRIVITHVDAPYLAMSVEVQKDLSKYAYIEHCTVQTLPTNAGIPLKQIARDIQEVGPERCILSTDLGQDYNIRPVLGFHAYLAGLMREGIGLADVSTMVRTNPALLVS